MDSKDVTLFRQARDAAKKRLFEVEEECNRLESEKLSLQATVASLDELLEDVEPVYSGAFAAAIESIKAMDAITATGLNAALDPLYGLTEACRQLLAIIPNTGVQISEIVKMLEDRSFDFSNYSKPISAVYTIFTRFCKSGEAKIAARTSGGRPLFAPTAPCRRVGEAAPKPIRNRGLGEPLSLSETTRQFIEETASGPARLAAELTGLSSAKMVQASMADFKTLQGLAGTSSTTSPQVAPSTLAGIKKADKK